MHIFTSLYMQAARDRPHATESMVDPETQKRKLEEARRKAQEKQEAKERARLEEEKRKKEKHAKKNRPKRTPFNFDTVGDTRHDLCLQNLSKHSGKAKGSCKHC